MNFAQMLQTEVKSLETRWSNTGRASTMSKRRLAARLTEKDKAELAYRQETLRSLFKTDFTSGDIVSHVGVNSAHACRWCTQLLTHNIIKVTGKRKSVLGKPSTVYGWVEDEQE